MAAGKEHPMYRALAYGFVGLTGFLVLLLAWFWWQEHRAAARRRKLARRKA
jgi:Flp pilus assembly protein TadB